MGLEQPFKKVKLFSGIIYGDDTLYAQTRRTLTDIFGAVDLESEPFPFDFTTYYNDEMGAALHRRFISFEKLIHAEQLPDIKLMTNQMEMDSAVNGNRRINLDPGFLSDANVILATTKNHYHRIPLQKGIYAHMEYVIKKKNTLTPLEWTYPDYKSPHYMAFFNTMIPIFKRAVKTQID